MEVKMKLVIPVFLLVTCVPGFSQIIHAQKAEMGVPFGQVEGQLIVAGDVLIFVDSEKPEGSIAIQRSQIENLSVEQDMLMVETRVPFRDRSGERSRLMIKLSNASGAGEVMAWRKAVPGNGAGEPSASRSALNFGYSVKHQHFPFGECNGRIVVTQDRFSYESVENAGHSRQWVLKDVKELKRDNPYEIKVTPFDGNEYAFKLVQKGMPSDEYHTIVNAITEARMPK
jgi:hypothetical protein